MRIRTGYFRSLKLDKFFKVYKQRKRKRYLATIYDIVMYMTSISPSIPSYLKTRLKARLSILILSKADPTKGI